MGVDCKIYLPSRVNVRDVATVIAILLGNKVRKEPLGSDGWHVQVDGVKVEPCSGTLAECCQIKVNCDGEERWFLYHFEFGREGKRGIMPRSTARNIALCKGLADFFGGIVDFSDCDDREADYYVEEKFDIHGEDNEAFYRKQSRMLEVHPLSKSEIDECEEVCAYKRAA